MIDVVSCESLSNANPGQLRVEFNRPAVFVAMPSINDSISFVRSGFEGFTSVAGVFRAGGGVALGAEPRVN